MLTDLVTGSGRTGIPTHARALEYSVIALVIAALIALPLGC